MNSEAPRPSRQDGTGTTGLPRNVLHIDIVPLDLAYPASGGTGHLPADYFSCL